MIVPAKLVSIEEVRRPVADGDRKIDRGQQPLFHGVEPQQRGIEHAAFGSAVGRACRSVLAYAKGASTGLFARSWALAEGEAGGMDLAVRVRRGFEGDFKTGLRVLVLAVGLAGGWAAFVPLTGAVVVAGTLVVRSNIKKVQHPTGGVVAQIAAHNGMHVKAGEVVMRLDATQARANLQVVTKQLDEIHVRMARLVAERDGLAAIKMPAGSTAPSNEDGIAALYASERVLFDARAAARQSQKDLLRSRIAQLEEEIGGLDAQIKAKQVQLDLISSELKGVQDLFEKNLVPLTRLTSLQREAARLGGERGQLVSSIAETKAKINEAQLQAVRIDQDFRAEVVKDLRESQAKDAELTERRIAAQDQLDRIDIRAPTSGVIHELAVHTVGGVISAGEVVMEIVPDSDDLQIEARVAPNEIDQVRLGQPVMVRFSAFDQGTTPQLSGIVSYVAADLSHDQQSSTSYYTVRVAISDEQRQRLNGLKLVSGMPAEMFLETGSRTMLSYMFKPIIDQLRRAFRER